MMPFLIVIHIIACLVLIAVILLQAGRGQGFGGTFGSGEGTQTIFGTRSADFLSKATSVCAVLFLFTCLGLDIMEARKGSSLLESSPKLKAEDLKALQQALKDLETKEAARKTPEAGADQAKSETAPIETAPQGSVPADSTSAVSDAAVSTPVQAADAAPEPAVVTSVPESVPSAQTAEPPKPVEQK